MVNQLTRLGLGSMASPEQKRLAMDLAAVAISWEQRRRATVAANALNPPVHSPRHLIPSHLLYTS